MGTCYLNKISSGVSLNFKIIAYTSIEKLNIATPGNNTIGVVTDVDITGWMFSPVEPDHPFTGMMWFKTSNSGARSFNALKKNGIDVHLVSAHQYIGDEWVDRTARIYQSDVWLGWEPELYYLFKDGNHYTEYTGGWTNVSPTAEKLSASYSAEQDYGASVSISTVNPGDLTYASVLRVVVDDYNERFCVYLRDLSGNRIGEVTATSVGMLSMDLSSISGWHFVVLESSANDHGNDMEGNYVNTYFTVSEVQILF
jgi:hypothetical protein